jgi:hypothetical protein
MNRRLHWFVLSFTLIFVALIAAQARKKDITAERVLNLAQANRLLRQALVKIADVEGANEVDVRGHAEKAKELLGESAQELALAMESPEGR